MGDGSVGSIPARTCRQQHRLLHTVNPHTCDLVGHVPVMGQVLPSHQHQPGTFLLGIHHRHQLGDAVLPRHVVTGDHYRLLLNTCTKHIDMDTKINLCLTFKWMTFDAWQMAPFQCRSIKVVYPEAGCSVRGLWASPPEHRNSPGPCGGWLYSSLFLHTQHCWHVEHTDWHLGMTLFLYHNFI